MLLTKLMSLINVHAYNYFLLFRALALAVVYDATQKKLPKKKNPENPAWNYPREFGIIDSRRKSVLSLILVLSECMRLHIRISMFIFQLHLVQ